MKKYREYMDGVRVSDTLHQRLLGLEASGKRPVPWKRYGSIAAALVLVVGLGAWGLSQDEVYEPLVDYSPFNPELADEPMPDIALEEPGDVTEPGQRTLGGYEVISGSGENAMVSYYVLPYIEYGEPDGTEAANHMAADWDIPLGSTRRDLAQEEIIALLGGGDTVSTHLDWGGYELTGWAAWYEGGSFWGAYLYGYAGALDHFEFAVTAGQLPPTCFGCPTSVTQVVRGLTVTADGYDGKDGCTRRVSFMKDEYGYRFDLTSTDTEQAELLVSRLVCCVADNRLDLSVVGGTIPEFAPDYDPAYEDGTSGDAPDICGYPLNPNEAADPNYNTPANTSAPEDGSSIDTVGSIVPSMYQPAPPTLRVLCPEGLADSRSSNYEWSYTEPGSGATASVAACGPHPLETQDIPSLTTADETVTLNFFDLPDRVSVVCWPDSERRNTSAASQTANTVRGGQTYELTLKDGGWIYEIRAAWDGQGTASYVLYLIKS